MPNNKQVKLLLTAISSAYLLVGCNGGSSATQESTQPNSISTSTVSVPLSEQVATSSSIYTVGDNSGKSVKSTQLSTTDSCLALVDKDGKNYTTSFNSSQWWSTAQVTFAIKNTCNAPTAISNAKVTLDGYAVNGAAVTQLGDVAQSGSGPYMSVQTNNNIVTISTPECAGDYCSWAQLPAGAEKIFTVNSSLSSAINSVTVKQVILNGKTPEPTPEPVIKTGSMTVTINSVELKDSCTKQSCTAIVGVNSPSGITPLDQITFNPAESPIIERTYSNLLPGTYTLQINNGGLPTGTTFNYGAGNGSVTVVADTTAKADVNFKYSEPAVLSNVNFSVAGISDLAKFNGINSIEAEITDEKTGAKARIELPINGTVASLNGLTTNDTYTIKTQSIGNPQDELFYKGVELTGVKFKQGSNNQAITLTKVTAPDHKLTFNVSGIPSDSQVQVLLADSGTIDPNFYVYTAARVLNGTKLGFMSSNVAINVTAPAGYTLGDYQKVANSDANIDLQFTKNVVPNATFDYEVPFKDYNHKLLVSFNGVTKAKSVSLVTNFKPKLDYGTCFGGVVYDFNSTTTENNGMYTTVLSKKDGSEFNPSSGNCTLFGTDSGSALILSNAVEDPFVLSATVDNTSIAMKQPCAENGCKDPGNGFVNAGYYAQWSVWGRQYNPNNMPFNDINDIIYAFIGFDAATGNIKTLDASADNWGLAATTKAMLQYPYMSAHLSFGGWTNNGINTAPMFEQLASNPQAMQNFATQAVKLMRQTKFTGLDIDWEWWSDYSNSVAPAKKMLGFYKVLRAELDKAGREDGKNYTLTIAVNGGVDRITAMENPSNPNSVSNFWAQVNGLIDNVNVMNYDYHGAYDNTMPAYFQANYDFANVPSQFADATGQTSGWSIKDSMAAYQQRGVNSKKLVVGLPIYARTMKVSSDTNGGLFQTVSGAGFGDWETGVLDYKCLLNPVVDAVNGCGRNAIPNDIVFYNSQSTGNNKAIFDTYGAGSLQPWGYSPSTGTFVTFDDTWSVTAKTQKAIDGNLGGTMFWELDGDTKDPKTSLVKAVANKYQGK